MIGLFHFRFLIVDFRLNVPDLLNHSFDVSTSVHGIEEAEAEMALAANREGSRGLGWVQRIAAKGLKHIRQGSSETVVLFPTEQVSGLVERTPIIDRLPGSLIIDRRPGLLFELVGRQAEVCCIEACFI